MFERVTIIGVGLLGASLGLAMKRRGLARRVAGVGRRGSGSLEVAMGRGAIDEASVDAGAAVVGSDLVVLCTPIRQFKESLAQLAPRLEAGAIVTDVGSTKADVLRWAGESLPAGGGEGRGAVFVGSHPMAGSEKRGPEFAREDLYENAVCLVCTEPAFGEGAEAPGADAAAGRVFRAMEKVEALWRAVGMRTLRLPAAEHDRWVATISHLPHAAAFSLVNTVARHPEMLPAVAGGFLDTTRVASSDLEMWTDIFLTNRAAVVGAIDAFSTDLNALKKAIANGDEAAIRAAIHNAKETRGKLLQNRPAPT